MKVLLIHQYFNTPDTGGPLRSYYLAKALTESGVSTVVITTHNGSLAETKSIEGIEVHYLPVTYSNSFGFFRRVHSFLKFVWSIVKEAGKFKDADICYAISTPLTTGLAAIWIKIRYRIPFIFEVGDLWPEAPVQMGVVKNYFLKEVLYTLEKSIYKRAKAIVALSDDIRKYILAILPEKTVHVIPNMADTEFYKPGEKDAMLEKKFNTEHKFVISYIGTLGVANGLDFLIECARVCAKDNVPLCFLVCGDGAEFYRLKQRAVTLGLTNITFIGFQTRNGVRDVLNITDAVMVSFKPLPVLETGSPNKYFDGLAAGKLIIANVGGWIKDEIELHTCGIYVKPDEVESLPNLLQPFISNVGVLKNYQAHARTLAEEKYSRKILERKFQQLFSA